MPQYQGVWSLQQQMQALTSGQWATDPLFDYTTLLLQADNAANSAQNNTFLDSSTNAFAITRNGNTTQGSFTPFSLQPGEWSNFFNGSSSFMSLPASSNWLFNGDACLEAWVYRAADTDGIIFATGGASSADQFAIFVSEGLWWGVTSQTGLPRPNVNQWAHCVVTRSGSTIRRFINGVLVSTATNASAIGSSGSVAYIGSRSGASNFFNGYISNLRVVNGSIPTAYQTSSTTLGAVVFAPPTTATTTTSQGATAGDVKLITCQSNRFIDTSSSAATITISGSPSVQAFSPFAPQFQYTASVTGGSGYFDGTGDYLQSSGDFFSGQGTARTFQCWIYVVSMPGAGTSQGIFSGANSGGNLSLRYDSGGTLKLDNTGTAEIATSASGAIKAGQWTHVAVTRTTGNLYTLYVNGSSVGSGTNSTNMGSSTYLASLTGGSTLNGYMTDIRVTNTVETINVPTAPLTAISGTALLLNFTNAGILDGTMKNNLETVGNASVSTSVVKYGSGSMYFDGSGDYLVGKSTDLVSFGTGDFTIEMWVNPASVPASDRVLMDTRAAGTDSGYTPYINGGTLKIYSSSADRITSTSTIAANVWSHIAFVRMSGVMAVYINGIQSGTATYTGSMTCPGRITIGAGFDNAANYNGYIDDLRVTKGIARYTQNFIPPSVALPRQ